MAEQLHAPPPAEPSEDEHWLIFAAVIYMALTAANLMWGIAALTYDDYFDADELLFGDLSTWAVVHLAFGVLAGLTTFLLIRGSAAGPILGSLLALIHATAVLMSIGAYPLWSVVLLTLDGLIIYGLIVHGRPAPAPRGGRP